MDPMMEVQEVNAPTVEAMEQAFARLVKAGLTWQAADARVKANYERVNADPRLIMGVEELIKPI